MFFDLPTPLVKLEGFSDAHEVYIKRDDRTHPVISGNKFRKLKYNILDFEESGKKILVTKGGAYSNHIAAVAAAGQYFGFETAGIIRGEKPENPGVTLSYAGRCGMQLHYTTRAAFKDVVDQDVLFGESGYFIPEGGTNKLALKGCSELATELQEQTDVSSAYICLAGGTGGTTAGIADAIQENSRMVCFSALKGTWLKDEIESLLNRKVPALEVTDEFCFGGYAKTDQRLVSFINAFYEQYAIPLDPVYTAKMMFGLKELTRQRRFTEGSKIIAIHTGGLQGAFGYVNKGVTINWLEDSECREAVELKELMC